MVVGQSGLQTGCLIESFHCARVAWSNDREEEHAGARFGTFSAYPAPSGVHVEWISYLGPIGKLCTFVETRSESADHALHLTWEFPSLRRTTSRQPCLYSNRHRQASRTILFIFVPAARIAGSSGQLKLSTNGGHDHGHDLQPCVIASPITAATSSAAGKSFLARSHLRSTRNPQFDRCDV